jgi:hypothetical protein
MLATPGEGPRRCRCALHSAGHGLPQEWPPTSGHACAPVPSHAAVPHRSVNNPRRRYQSGIRPEGSAPATTCTARPWPGFRSQQEPGTEPGLCVRIGIRTGHGEMPVARITGDGRNAVRGLQGLKSVVSAAGLQTVRPVKTAAQAGSTLRAGTGGTREGHWRYIGGHGRPEYALPPRRHCLRFRTQRHVRASDAEAVLGLGQARRLRFGQKRSGQWPGTSRRSRTAPQPAPARTLSTRQPAL